MRKRPSIASVYLVSVSHQCIASVPTFETPHHIRHFFTLHSSFFTPHPSDFDGLETAPSASSDVNVARNVVRNVARGVARNVARNVARGVGRMRQYEHLTGAGSPPLFYISHNLSVEMGYFMDKLLTLTNLSGGRRALTDEVAFPPLHAGDDLHDEKKQGRAAVGKRDEKVRADADGEQD